LNFKDVTTRGAYYPDKSMATAVVSVKDNHNVYFHGVDNDVESSTVFAYYKYHERRIGKGRCRNRRDDEARFT